MNSSRMYYPSSSRLRGFNFSRIRWNKTSLESRKLLKKTVEVMHPLQFLKSYSNTNIDRGAKSGRTIELDLDRM